MDLWSRRRRWRRSCSGRRAPPASCCWPRRSTPSRSPARPRRAFALALSVLLSTRSPPTLPAADGRLPGRRRRSPRWSSAPRSGFVVQVFFTAVQMAGDLIDVTGGFSLQPAYDPLAMTQNAADRPAALPAGHHAAVHQRRPPAHRAGASPPPTSACPSAATCRPTSWPRCCIKAFSMMFLAALQIAGPMVAVLLLADVALALLSRAAPALNIFQIGFPVKIMLTLAMLGPHLPAAAPGARHPDASTRPARCSPCGAADAVAKDGPGGEKTEKPTPQRLKKARKEGQIPRTPGAGHLARRRGGQRAAARAGEQLVRRRPEDVRADRRGGQAPGDRGAVGR